MDPERFNLRAQLLRVAECKTLHEKVEVTRDALVYLPGSYKLWTIHLKAKLALVSAPVLVSTSSCAYMCFVQTKRKPFDVAASDGSVTSAFEDAIVFTFRMPSVWLLYMSWLADLGQLTALRLCLNRALRSLPVTQHALLWEHWSSLPIDWPVESRNAVMGRRLMFDPHMRIPHAKVLLAEGQVRQAVVQLMLAVDDEAKTGKKMSAEDTWGLLSTALSQLPDASNLPVGRILRSGIHRKPTEAGPLWCTLAELAIKSGAFEAARDIYEEAIASMLTVRDFAQVYDAYVKYEEALLASSLQSVGAGGTGQTGQGAAQHGGQAAGQQPWETLLPVSALSETVDDEDLRFARLEQLIDRQPLLLSSVLLRQNPHNVHEWQRRANTFAKLQADARVVETYADAIRTVDAHVAVGKPHTLWTAFARFYDGKGALDDARATLKHGTDQRFPTAEPTVTLWCSWVEMELRHGNVAEALKVAHAAVQPRKTGRDVSASARLWSLVLDLDMAYSPMAVVTASFQGAASTKAVTVAMVLAVAAHLQRLHAMEEAFRVYNTGLALFKWPLSADIWYAYITAFTGRYGGVKLERARDLFDTALADCPADKSAALLRLYAAFEEQHGSLRRCMALLDKACESVPPLQRYALYAVYLAKASEYYGALKTRPIYEKALQSCTPEACKILARRFAALETQLGELDRARAALRFGAQFADPRSDVGYWQSWADWEVTHGNEESYRDMLRVKRSYVLAAPQGAAVLQ